jgi:hypothetical protein
MAINTYPAIASPVKSVQRGSAAGAGTVTITAIDISKSMVNVFGTTSSGTVAASFGLNAPGAGNTTIIGPAFRGTSTNNYASARRPNAASAVTGFTYSGGGDNANTQSFWWSQAVAVNAGSAPTPNAGSNNLVAAVVQGHLSNSTSLVVTGACRWEVVEFN